MESIETLKAAIGKPLPGVEQYGQAEQDLYLLSGIYQLLHAKPRIDVGDNADAAAILKALERYDVQKPHYWAYRAPELARVLIQRWAEWARSSGIKVVSLERLIVEDK